MPIGIPFLALALLAVLAGVSFVTQATMNSALRSALGSPAWAAFVSYLGGTLTMAVVLLLSRQPLPLAAALARSAWWTWLGGLLGTVYVVITIVLLPRLGAGVVVGFLVLGQMLGSLVFDQYGWLGLAPHRADPTRVAGAIFLVLGAILVRR
jgi:transporter family-2 protein